LRISGFSDGLIILRHIVHRSDCTEKHVPGPMIGHPCNSWKLCMPRRTTWLRFRQANGYC
jgi:hypothetical protein